MKNSTSNPLNSYDQIKTKQNRTDKKQELKS
jgi:hypothetical protein